jgi:hypothetical protein
LHPGNHRPLICAGCATYHQLYRAAVHAMRLEEAGKVRARLQAKPKPRERSDSPAEDRMNATTWSQWYRNKNEYQRHLKTRRDREIRAVYRSEVFRRDFRSAVPVVCVDSYRKPRGFYPIHGLLRDAA